ncbi:MAG: phosphoribosylanthranilate isomerase [bacterium]
MKPIQNIIQIAGIKDADEAQLLIDAGVDYLGFPLRLEVHQEDISEEAAGRIIRASKPSTYGVLITYLDKASAIVALCTQLGTNIVQLHGRITIKELALIKEIDPEMSIIKSLIICGNNLPDLQIELEQYTPFVEAFITDTYDPTTGASGATGKTHDWSISRKLVEVSAKPIILAGGLNSDNVAQAIAIVRPAGVDVHTGVEGPDGRKDRKKVSEFVIAARTAFTNSV